MKDLIKFIGKEVSVELGGLLILVKVTDVKRSYGKDRYQVTPVTGEGSIWTEKVIL